MGSPPKKSSQLATAQHDLHVNSHHGRWFSHQRRNMCPWYPPENPGWKSLEYSHWALCPHLLSRSLIQMGCKAQGSTVHAAAGSFPLGGTERVCPHLWVSQGDTWCGAVGIGARWTLVIPIASPCGSVLEVSEGGPSQDPPDDQEQSQGPHLFWENPGLIKWSHVLLEVHHTSPEVGDPSVSTPSLPGAGPPTTPCQVWGGSLSCWCRKVIQTVSS